MANRTDRDAGRILGLMLDSGADLENEPRALANYIRAQGGGVDMKLVGRMSKNKTQLNPALLACAVTPYPGDALARKLIEAGASVNDIADQNSSMLLEALNAKADPRLIKLLVANGADTELEGGPRHAAGYRQTPRLRSGHPRPADGQMKNILSSGFSRGSFCPLVRVML